MKRLRYACDLRFHNSARAPIFVVMGALWVFGAPEGNGATWYVRTNGNDALPGSSWAEARRTLGASISAAAGGDEIWVARGTYAEHVTLKPGLAFYGGFAGTESARGERDWVGNLTVIWGTTNKAVVTITNAGPDTRVDGFTIGGGNAIHGGGIAMVGSAPVIAHNTIRNNITDGAGAGVSIWGFYILSSTDYYFPVITNNLVALNQSINDEGDGGGIAVVGSSPLIAWNVIVLNTATRNGGGIACWRNSLPTIANNFIEQNSASYDETTASSGGGGIFASATDLDGRPIDWAVSAPTIINNVIAANGGRHGGGITVVDSRLGAASIANNTIVANNGAGIYWANTWPTNDNNIVAFNARGFERGLAGTSDAEIRFNDVYGNAVLGAPANYVSTPDRTGTTGNIFADPKFANWAIGEFHLQPDSPCVNAGSTPLVELGEADIDREPRIRGPAVDMGADESAGAAWTVPNPVIRVSANGDDSDGKSWATAKKTVAGGIAAAAATGGEVWIAQGTYSERILPPAFIYLYGGFAGDETNRGVRNPVAHPTILDGGGVPTVVYYRNAGYRVSALDGFTVQHGGIYTGGDPFNPDLTARTGGRGGAIYCRVSAPDITGNLIRSNSIGSPYNSYEALGGGIYCYLAHATIAGNTIQDNEVLKRGTGAGGGVYCQESMATIERNVFTRNHAANGAALYGALSGLRVVGNVVQTNALYNNVGSLYMGSGYGALTFWLSYGVLVEGNSIQGNVAVSGGGVHLGSCFSARVVNNVIADNLAWDYSGFGGGGQGGGVYCMVNLGSTNIVIANNTLVGNRAPATFLGEGGGGMALMLVTTNLVVANNIVVSNSSGIWRGGDASAQPTLAYNCLLNSNANDYINLPAGPSDFQADPKFVDRAGGDFHVLAGSPCIDAGGPVGAPRLDKDGLNRPLDGDNNGVAAVDVGAYEFVHPAADTDADGMPDTAEGIAGTNPTDAASVLRLSASVLSAENSVVLRWASVVGRTYKVEWSPAFEHAPGWQVLSEKIPGCGTALECRDPISGASPRFYRLGVVKD